MLPRVISVTSDRNLVQTSLKEKKKCLQNQNVHGFDRIKFSGWLNEQATLELDAGSAFGKVSRVGRGQDEIGAQGSLEGRPSRQGV